MSERHVTMRSIKDLIREGLVRLDHISDDGEYVRFKILPNGPVVGMYLLRGPALVVEGETIHINQIKMMPWAFTDVTGCAANTGLARHEGEL